MATALRRGYGERGRGERDQHGPEAHPVLRRCGKWPERAWWRRSSSGEAWSAAGKLRIAASILGVSGRFLWLGGGVRRGEAAGGARLAAGALQRRRCGGGLELRFRHGRGIKEERGRGERVRDGEQRPRGCSPGSAAERRGPGRATSSWWCGAAMAPVRSCSSRSLQLEEEETDFYKTPPGKLVAVTDRSLPVLFLKPF